MDRGSAPKRFQVGINVALQVALVVVILVFINWAAHLWLPYLISKKADLTRSQYYKLSDKTLQLLKSLKEPVDVIVFFQPVSEDYMTRRVFSDIRNLLDEYQNATGKLKIRYVDPDRDPVGAEKLVNDYGVKILNVVVFVQGKRSKFVEVKDLVDMGQTSPFDRSGGRIKAFKGEQQFTSAIQNVIEEKQPKVYFVQGHGEKDPDAYDKKGYSTLIKYIKRDNLVVDKLNILEKQQIPKDCDLLIICGPEKAFDDLELKFLQEYLAQNGRMMILLDGLKYGTRLEKFLAEYGVRVGNDIVLCQFLHLMKGKQIDPIAPAAQYGSHEITKSLRKEGVQVLLSVARSVEGFGGDSAKQRVTDLVETPPEAWAETDIDALRNGKAQVDAKDKKGPVSVAVAVEPSAAGEMEREGMRMVVFGSSSFIDNQNCGAAGNLDLFLNSLNWLIKRQQMIGIAPKMAQEFSLALSDFQMRGLFITEVCAIPLAAAAFGVLVWLKRRR
jgi:ABC-type uncharacterized transport system involved in gliding motility auxiliary subunit